MLAERLGIAQLRELAGRERQFAVRLGRDDLPRLSDSGLGAEPESGAVKAGDATAGTALDVKLRVANGAYGFPELVGNVEGSVVLACQRCLGSLAWPVDIAFRLNVVTAEDELDELAERFDALVAGEQGIALRDVVEDEVLASLPLAPAHASVAKCAPDAVMPELLADVGQAAAAGGENVAERSTRPFANLQALLDGADGGKTGPSDA